MQHYVGFTRTLPQRLQADREGDGYVTTRRAFDQGIGFTLARVWFLLGVPLHLVDGLL
jgi:hypothetical protein